MNSEGKAAKIVISALFSFLVGSLGIYAIPDSSAEEQAKAQVDTPVTDCYESRESYTTVKRTENAVPKYGFPNIKCSKKTGAALWYGNPFDGTIPMGDAPEIKDNTRVNHANAVVKPREPHLTYFNMGPNGCKTCHDGNIVPVPKDKKPRQIAMHQDVVANSLELQHGRGALWCLDCHSATNRNKLVNRQGVEISFNQPQRLCGSCHGELYIDWRAGIHGKRIGDWASNGKKRWWVCTECHNPHTVGVHRFDPVKTESSPPLPRGMKNADYERVGHEGH